MLSGEQQKELQGTLQRTRFCLSDVARHFALHTAVPQALLPSLYAGPAFWNSGNWGWKILRGKKKSSRKVKKAKLELSRCQQLFIPPVGDILSNLEMILGMRRRCIVYMQRVCHFI